MSVGVRITLRQLEIFRAVAATGSTSAAARELPLSQSATSAAINELETTLAQQLFDRVGKRLILNDRGRILLPAAMAMLDGGREIESLGGAGGAEELRVHASTTIGNYVLPALLARYRTATPEARITLHIGNTREVVESVLEFEADVGFIEGPCHTPGVTVVPWRTDELLIVAAPTHPLAVAAGRRKLSAGRLARAIWLVREAGSGTREAVEQALSPHLPNLLESLVLGSSEAIKNATAAGLGVSCLSRAVVEDHVTTGRLVVLATCLPQLLRRFSWIQHRQKILSRSVRAFVDFCDTSPATPRLKAQRTTNARSIT